MRKLFYTSIAVFLFTFTYDFIIHWILLKDLYLITTDVWRPPSEHKMEFITISQILFSAFFSLFYFLLKPLDPIRYGVFVGLLMSSHHVAEFCYLPVPLSLVLFWVMAAIVHGLFAGFVLWAVLGTGCFEAESPS